MPEEKISLEEVKKIALAFIATDYTDLNIMAKLHVAFFRLSPEDQDAYEWWITYECKLDT